ncbi:hypothetical protein GCM10023238_25130 [Streptomyces heliomycini]
MIRLDLNEVSAKLRTGGVNDEPEDLSLPHWAGVVPLRKGYDAPLADPGPGPRHRNCPVSGGPVMPVHPWDAPRDETSGSGGRPRNDFGQLAVSGPPGAPSHVQPPHFARDPERGGAGRPPARPHPLRHAVEACPKVLLSVADDYVYVPGRPSPAPRPSTVSRRASTPPSTALPCPCHGRSGAEGRAPRPPDRPLPAGGRLRAGCCPGSAGSGSK